MRIWITRARPGAEATAARVRELGHEPFVWPLLQVRSLPTPVDLAGVDALAFTSANAVAAFAEREPRRDLAVFAVGDATAEAARAAGFGQVSSAAGDVAALAALIARARPGVVLHPCAREPAGDLAAALADEGVAARAVPVYETVALGAPADLAGLDAVLVHSPRASRLLAAVADAAGLLALCISAAAAEPLRRRNFPRVLTAPLANEAALLKLLAEQACERP